MGRWKVEKCSLDGAEGIFNAMEADGYEIKEIFLQQSRGLAPIAGGEGEGGGKLLGEFQTSRVIIIGQMREKKG